MEIFSYFLHPSTSEDLVNWTQEISNQFMTLSLEVSKLHKDYPKNHVDQQLVEKSSLLPGAVERLHRTLCTRSYSKLKSFFVENILQEVQEEQTFEMIYLLNLCQRTAILLPKPTLYG